MLDPELVRRLVSSMQRVSSLPVTVKCRIGVDAQDSYDQLKTFIHTVSGSGSSVRKFIIHARKCHLKGLNPKQNRDVPPLRYDVVHDLVRDFPDLTFILNGGILTLEEGRTHMEGGDGHPRWDHPVAGVMIGRAVINNPLLLANADSTFFGKKDTCVSRRRVIASYLDYCEWAQSDEGPKRRAVSGRVQQATTSLLLKPVHNLCSGLQHNARFKVLMNDLYVQGVRGGDPNPSPRDIVEGALSCLNDEELDAPIGNGPSGSNATSLKRRVEVAEEMKEDIGNHIIPS